MFRAGIGQFFLFFGSAGAHGVFFPVAETFFAPEHIDAGDCLVLRRLLGIRDGSVGD